MSLRRVRDTLVRASEAYGHYSAVRDLLGSLWTWVAILLPGIGTAIIGALNQAPLLMTAVSAFVVAAAAPFALLLVRLWKINPYSLGR